MKLELGMYIRTIDGIITKIIDNRDSVIVKTDDYTTHLRSKIIKASHNLIDLLVEGDYVNDYKIMHFGNEYYDEDLDDYVEGKSIVLGNEEGCYRIPPKDIKTIVTKEQFKRREYKVN